MVVKRRLRAGQRGQHGPPSPAESAVSATTCPLCGRPLIAGPSVDLHHPVPRSRGGREVVPMHRICHQKIPSVFTETELELQYHDMQRLRSHPAIADFIRWIARKPPEYFDRSRTTREKRRR